jgi:hypothetical protein
LDGQLVWLAFQTRTAAIEKRFLSFGGQGTKKQGKAERRETDETFFSHAFRRPGPLPNRPAFSTTYTTAQPKSGLPLNRRHATLKPATNRAVESNATSSYNTPLSSYP